MSSTTRMDGAGGDLQCAIKKWNVIYPVYLNSKKTVAEGRRIAAAKACLYTTYVEIADCCKHLQIPHVIDYASLHQNLRHPEGTVEVQMSGRKHCTLCAFLLARCSFAFRLCNCHARKIESSSDRILVLRFPDPGCFLLPLAGAPNSLLSCCSRCLQQPTFFGLLTICKFRNASDHP